MKNICKVCHLENRKIFWLFLFFPFYIFYKLLRFIYFVVVPIGSIYIFLVVINNVSRVKVSVNFSATRVKKLFWMKMMIYGSTCDTSILLT